VKMSYVETGINSPGNDMCSTRVHVDLRELVRGTVTEGELT
jgi:hypothetical protein